MYDSEKNLENPAKRIVGELASFHTADDTDGSNVGGGGGGGAGRGGCGVVGTVEFWSSHWDCVTAHHQVPLVQQREVVGQTRGHRVLHRPGLEHRRAHITSTREEIVRE